MAVVNIEIWRFAQQLVLRYGESAEYEAALRADAALVKGDRHGFLQWMRIAMPLLVCSKNHRNARLAVSSDRYRLGSCKSQGWQFTNCFHQLVSLRCRH